MSATRVTIDGRVAYVLGQGRLNNPSFVRMDDSYTFVGVSDSDGEWKSIMPYHDEDGWLSELGPGQLVFFPDPKTEGT